MANVIFSAFFILWGQRGKWIPTVTLFIQLVDRKKELDAIIDTKHKNQNIFILRACEKETQHLCKELFPRKRKFTLCDQVRKLVLRVLLASKLLCQVKNEGYGSRHTET